MKFEKIFGKKEARNKSGSLKKIVLLGALIAPTLADSDSFGQEAKIKNAIAIRGKDYSANTDHITHLKKEDVEVFEKIQSYADSLGLRESYNYLMGLGNKLKGQGKKLTFDEYKKLADLAKKYGFKTALELIEPGKVEFSGIPQNITHPPVDSRKKENIEKKGKEWKPSKLTLKNPNSKK